MELDFSKDNLGRQKFADLLISYASRLAAVPITPAGRVIAVDAPWGGGKSWVAKRLPAHFETDSRIGKCVYVDAFQFDYHQDPFAVVTSVILEGFSEQPAAVGNLKDAAVKVLKVSLPAAAKHLLKAGSKAIGIDSDELIEGVLEAGADVSEKAIEQMLDAVEKTNATTAAFKAKLSELANTSENSAPLVVIIDELDRCRPSYALELLERVKHLFDVPNVVFIFFVHTPALHSAIRKTYGQDIDPVEYLRKFFALTIGLPIASKPDYEKSDETDFLAEFLNTQFGSIQGTNDRLEAAFRHSIAVFAPVFRASFRDLESAMLLWQLVPKNAGFHPDLAGYLLLFKVKEPLRFNSLKSSLSSSYKMESDRLGIFEEYEDGLKSRLRDYFSYAFDTSAYSTDSNQKRSQGIQTTPIETCRAGMIAMHQTILRLGLEYVRL